MREGAPFYQRGWLNPEDRGGLAAFEARVDQVDAKGFFSAHLEFGDCTRTVTLDFDAYGDSDQRDVLRTKARRLKRTVDTFVAALMAALDDAERAAP